MEKMRFESVDGFQENIRRLADIFPSCVKEQKDNDGKTIRKVDINTLQLLLGINQKESETCEFSWVGKREAVKEVYKPIRKTLRPVVQDSVEWDSTGNLYIEGDNLDVLKLLQESYLDSVKVIYIDPPYNTGNDFIYADDFRIRAREYVNAGGASQDDKNRMYQNLDYSGRYHSDWCSMIYARLLAARNLLCDDGVIFISIDDNEQANLKKICDEVFGERNFVNCFIWNCSTAGGIRPKFASKTHEYILCYAKNKTCLDMFFAPLSGEAIKMYREKDERGLYRDKDFVFKNKSTNANQKYEIICPDGERVRPKDGYIYRFVRERFEQAKEEGLVTFKRTKTGPLVDQNGDQAHWNIYIKKYLGDAMGAPSTLIPKEAVSIYNAGTQCVQELFDGKRVFENVKPLLISSGCGIPGIMASRTIEQDNDRRLTIMTATFIPCGAKLPVIALMGGVIAGEAAGYAESSFIAPLMYFIGIAAVLISAIILKKTKMFSGKPAPFVMELPQYHMPQAKTVLLHVWERLKGFMIKAGTILFLACIVMWFLGGFGFSDGKFGIVQDSANSLLAMIGGALAVLFKPLGFGEWQPVAAALSGFTAKEAIVTTMGVLANVSGDVEDTVNVAGKVAAWFPSAMAAFSFLLFNLLDSPCLAAIATMAQQMQSRKWFWFAVVFQNVFAYVVSLSVYQIGTFVLGGAFTVGTAVGIAIAVILLILLFRPDPYKNKKIYSKRSVQAA